MRILEKKLGYLILRNKKKGINRLKKSMEDKGEGTSDE